MVGVCEVCVRCVCGVCVVCVWCVCEGGGVAWVYSHMCVCVWCVCGMCVFSLTHSLTLFLSLSLVCALACALAFFFGCHVLRLSPRQLRVRSGEEEEEDEDEEEEFPGAQLSNPALRAHLLALLLALGLFCPYCRSFFRVLRAPPSLPSDRALFPGCDAPHKLPSPASHPPPPPPQLPPPCACIKKERQIRV